MEKEQIKFLESMSQFSFNSTFRLIYILIYCNIYTYVYTITFDFIG